ncbi:outer membrane beta-barrel protein [Sphingomonas sanguinis]|uniref:outer membrane beta-barrel protein n=1 Tax=Sphingomonas sp. LC-1 TaxID=3110957 RepID=UPI0021BAFC3C|nr:outer membrane beta-barrel protein [Sphingomonas sp. LC-1]MCT8000327.1 outer membrane beta-barrel protein [Sphingomonas sp. LC-1]
MIRSPLAGSATLMLMSSLAMPVMAQTTPTPRPRSTVPGRLTLPAQSDPMATQQPATPVPPPLVDPQTGRPVDTPPRASGVANETAADATPASDVPPVPAYIPLPSGSTQQTELPTARIADRALSATRLPGDTVLLRRRPGYDAPGLRVGGLVVHPYIDAGLAYDANVYAEENPRTDIFAHLLTGFDAASDWGRHRAVISGYIRRREYARYTSENTTTYRLVTAGRYDATSHVSFTTEASHQRIQLERGAVEEVSSLALPSLYDLTVGQLGTRIEYGPTRLTASGGVSRTDFTDNRSLTGQLTDQRFRTFTGYTGEARIEHDVWGTRALYGQFNFERRRFETAEAKRLSNADVYALTAGLRGALTQLIRGHVGIGIIRVDFQDPSANSISSLTFDTQVDWLVRDRTTISLSGARELRTAAQRGVRAALFSNLTISANEEVRRNLILSLGIRQQWTDYINDIRRASATGVTLGANWLLDRHWTIKPLISYLRRTDRGFNLDLGPEDAQVAVSASYRF